MMSDGSQGGPPPGWYEDASRADRLRWWNGAAWTEDYRPVATDAAAAVSPEAPLSRAQLRARRAADADAEGEGTAVSAIPATVEEPQAAVEASVPVAIEHEEPHAAAVWPAPSSLAEPAGERDEASAAPPSAAEPAAPVPQEATAPPAASKPRTSPNGRTAGPSPGAKAEPVPDQIIPRRPAPVDDRLPTPIVYQPMSSSYVGEMRPPLPEAAPANVPARASIVLLALAALGGLAVVFWLADRDESIAGLVSLVSVAFAAGAFFLAIGGLIVAAQRSASRLMSGIALVLSIALVAWLAIVATQQALAILA